MLRVARFWLGKNRQMKNQGTNELKNRVSYPEP